MFNIRKKLSSRFFSCWILLAIILLYTSSSFGAVQEWSYPSSGTGDFEVYKNSSLPLWITVNDAPTNAVITSMQAKFEYIAYGAVQNYVSARFNRGSDPSNSGGDVLVSQGTLPASPTGSSTTSDYKFFNMWKGQKVNSTYYFRFFLGDSPYSCTIKKIYVRISYEIPSAGTATIDKTMVDALQGKINVTWSGFSSNVNIALYKGTSILVDYAITDQPSSGSFELGPGGWEHRCDYRIKVELRSQPSYFTWAQLSGDADFCAGSLTLTSPNGGEIFTSGQNIDVTWDKNNVTDNVQIDLYRNTSPTKMWIANLEPSVSNDGSESVTIPSSVTAGTDYLIGISNKRTDQNNGQVWDFSNSSFEIAKPSAGTATIDKTMVDALQGKINVTWSGFSGNVNIALYKGTSVLVDYAITDQASSGSFELGPGGWEHRCDYRIKVELRSQPSYFTWAQLSGDVDFCAGSLTLISPNGGETFTSGQNVFVTWDKNNVTDNVQIDLYKNTLPTKTWITNLEPSVSNDGSESVTIPSSVAAGTDYLIGISNKRTDQNNGQVWDFSDSNFIINTESSSIESRYPTSGALLYQGINYNIQWSTTGNVGNVQIHLYHPDGTTVTPLAANTENDGAYPFNIPAGDPNITPGTGYKIGISEASDGDPSAFSGEFTIAAQSSDAPSSQSGSLAVDALPGHELYIPSSGDQKNLYRYGPSIILENDNVFDIWVCSPYHCNNSMDRIQYCRGTINIDGTTTGCSITDSWTIVADSSTGEETCSTEDSTWATAIESTPGSKDGGSTCDPGVFSYGGYYYVGYTGTDNTVGGGVSNNAVFIARCDGVPDGTVECEKWNGSNGWGGEKPEPIIECDIYSGRPCTWGAGQPSFVVVTDVLVSAPGESERKEDHLYIYYTENGSRVIKIVLKDISGTVNSEWPELVDESRSTKIFSNEDAEGMLDGARLGPFEVKYIDNLDKFMGIAIANEFSERDKASNPSEKADNFIFVYESIDGINFSPVIASKGQWEEGRIQNQSHNIGISGDSQGHFDSTKITNFIAYGIGAHPESGAIPRANWPTFLNPIKVSTELALDDLNDLFRFDWDVLDRESIYSIIQNSISDPGYTYTIWDPRATQVITPQTNAWIRANHSTTDNPIGIISGEQLITPWLDSVWGNDISDDDSFNTVYKGIPAAGDKFEVISFIDQFAPFCGTRNDKSYFFTYDTKNDANGDAVTFAEWIDYLKAVTVAYGRRIDTLSIFAHGSVANVNMSGGFKLKDDLATRLGIERLKNENILATDATVLLFSCNVAKDVVGQTFIQNLADWSGATVYGSSHDTGPYLSKGDLVSRDWNLDVRRLPTDPGVSQAPLSVADAPNRVSASTLVTLDGTKSTDADDGIASYTWAQINGTSVSLSDVNSIQPVFTAPTVSQDEVLEFQLTVTDHSGLQSKDTCAITITTGDTLPSHPTGVSAHYNSSVGRNYLTWNNVSVAATYKVYWSTSPGVTVASNVMPETETTDYGHTDVASGSCYYYRVSAVSQGGGESGLSSEVFVCLPDDLPDTPTGINAIYHESSIRNYITWNQAINATGYKVYWGTSPDVTFASNVMPETQTTDFGHTGVENGSCYYYKVSAVNPAGESGLSSEASVCLPAAIPDVPTGVTAIYRSSDNQNFIDWSLANGAIGYRVYWDTNPGVSVSSQMLSEMADTDSAHSGVTSGSCYYYRVSAVNTVGESGLSSEVSVCLPAVLPETPTSINVIYQVASNRNFITWNQVNYATSYKVYWDTSAGVSDTSHVMPETVTTDFRHTDVESGICYYYRVSAVNSEGESGLSSEVSVCLKDIQLSLLPTSRNVSAASGFTTIDVNVGANYISWEASSNDPWLIIIDGQSGIGNGAITIGYDANPGAPRTGTISVEASDAINSPQTLEIHQDTNFVSPEAEFAVSPRNGLASLPVIFIDQTTGAVDSRLWNFGDGQTSDQDGPIHTYDSPGVYTVSLTVTGPGGTDIETKTDWIIVDVDTDGDGVVDRNDLDDDDDGITDEFDAFPQDPTEWLDTDGDGQGDNADTDDDNDGALDADDNCPKIENPGQENNDGNDIGDACEGIPYIHSITPNSASLGSQITIEGINFGTLQGTGSVTFYRDIPATSIVLWTDTQIVCAIPQNAQEGCLKVTTEGGETSCAPLTISDFVKYPVTGSVDFINAQGNPVEAFALGDQVKIRVDDPDVDVNPEVQEELTVSVTSLTEDTGTSASHTEPVADTNNMGDGTLVDIQVGDETKTEDWTVECVLVESVYVNYPVYGYRDEYVFGITGTVSGEQVRQYRYYEGQEAGYESDGAEIGFKFQAGTAAFSVGDKFTFSTTAAVIVGETVTLTETAADSGVFEGSIAISESAVVNGNDVLEVTSGDLLTVYYEDAAGDWGYSEWIKDTALYAATIVNGTVLTADTTWPKAGSPYLLTGDVTVGAGVTLTIEPGVRVLFLANEDDTGNGETPYDSELIVNGVLQAVGTAQEPIVFTSSSQDPTMGDWGGIYFGDMGPGPGPGPTEQTERIEHVVVEYSGEYGILVEYHTEFTIADSVIRRNSGTGIKAQWSTSLSVIGCTIENNGGAGLYTQSTASTVEKNTITENGSNGIYINDCYYNALITGNIISNNGGYEGGYGFRYYYGSGDLAFSGNTLEGNSSGGVHINWRGSESPTVSGNTISNSGSYGIYIYNSRYNVQPTVEDNTVSGCSYGIYIQGKVTADITDNVIDKSNRGIYVNYSDANGDGSFAISGNVIVNNDEYGIYTSGYANPTINYNDIYGNGTYAIENHTAFEIYARFNWWGDDVTQIINAGDNPKDLTIFYDIFDDGNSGLINYSAWYWGALHNFDSDGDGKPDDWDNCPSVYNPSQSDLDEDDIGDACDDDADGDKLPDVWEQAYGLDHLNAAGSDGADGDKDGDRWSNYREFLNGTLPNDATSVPPPAISQAIPHNNAGIDDNRRIPLNTSFAVLIEDQAGLDITDFDTVKFSVNDGVNPTYVRTLSNSELVMVAKLSEDPDTAVTKFWIAYHRFAETDYGNFPYAATIRVTVNLRDSRAVDRTVETFAFKIETESQHTDAEANSPQTDPLPGDDPSLDPATGLNSGIVVPAGDAMAGAKIVFNSNEVVTPTLGSSTEVPSLSTTGENAVGVPMNLQPPTVFETPVKLLIPCPGYEDVSLLSVYYYNGKEWILACDAAGNVLDDSWMVPGSRVNLPFFIELKAYHFTGVQAGGVADSDNDGIPDRIEDYNQNGVVDSDETDPNNIDTDGDGIQDGTEIGLDENSIFPDTDTNIFQPDQDPSTTTDPLDSDSDNDFIPDGEEDPNFNGMVDEGETDPSNRDTDGDGAGDGEEVNSGSNPLSNLSYPALTTVGLNEGYNLIALPADVSTASDIRGWLPLLGDSSDIEKIMIYDSEAGIFKTFLPEDSSNEFFALGGGEGLIVIAKKDKDIIFTSVQCIPKNLKQGFNFIGFACAPGDYTAFKLLNELGSDNVSSIQGYSNERGSFVTATFKDGQAVGVDFPIVTGKGYFVYMIQGILNFGF